MLLWDEDDICAVVFYSVIYISVASALGWNAYLYAEKVILYLLPLVPRRRGRQAETPSSQTGCGHPPRYWDSWPTAAHSPPRRTVPAHQLINTWTFSMIQLPAHQLINTWTFTVPWVIFRTSVDQHVVVTQAWFILVKTALKHFIYFFIY